MFPLCLFLPMITGIPPSESFDVRKSGDEDCIASPVPRYTVEQRVSVDLADRAKSLAGSISALLGGSAWINQSTGDLGLIRTKPEKALRVLRGLVNASMKPSDERNGLFSSRLVDALTQSYQERRLYLRDRNLALGKVDYINARKLFSGEHNE